MIKDDFDLADIAAVNFAVALRSNSERYFVPTDTATKNTLKTILQSTVEAFDQLDGDWRPHDISEDYGKRRRVYAERDTDYLSDLSAIFDEGALDDLSGAHEHIRDIEYYYSIFFDSDGRKVIGIKKGMQLKGVLGARNRLVRLADDTLQLIEDDVLKLDPEFDAIITSSHILMLKVRAVEYMANIVEHVAGAAAHKVQQIHDTISFLDLSRIQENIFKHPQMARMAASILDRDDLSDIKRDRIEDIAAHQGLVFKEVDGRLQCRREDEAKLLEILDSRLYHLDLTATGPVPYRATGRQKVIK